MAFFNLTQLGAQDPFRLTSATVAPSPGTVHAQKIQGNLAATEAQSSSPQPQATSTSDTRIESPIVPCHSEMYSTAKDSASHEGSHGTYTDHMTKHQRNSRGPGDLYRRPLSTSQMYGWWMNEGEPLKEEWTKGERRVHVNSEMTRFVDEMSLTNKDFSLY